MGYTNELAKWSNCKDGIGKSFFGIGCLILVTFVPVNILWGSDSSSKGVIGQCIYDALVDDEIQPGPALKIVTLGDVSASLHSSDGFAVRVMTDDTNDNSINMFGMRIRRDIEEISILAANEKLFPGMFKVVVKGKEYGFHKFFGGGDNLSFSIYKPPLESVRSPAVSYQKGSLGIKQALVKAGFSEDDAGKVVDGAMARLVRLDDESFFRMVIEADVDMLTRLNDPSAAAELGILLWVKGCTSLFKGTVTYFETSTERVYLVPHSFQPDRNKALFWVEAYRKDGVFSWRADFWCRADEKLRAEYLSLLRWMLTPPEPKSSGTRPERNKCTDNEYIMKQIKLLEETPVENELQQELKELMIEDYRKQLREHLNK